jgi:hypothetical protein
MSPSLVEQMVVGSAQALRRSRPGNAMRLLQSVIQTCVAAPAPTADSHQARTAEPVQADDIAEASAK